MRPLIAKIKPASGFSRWAHIGSNVVLALLVFVLVRTDFVSLALSLILLSKWRMLAVRPRFWPANARANSVDIIVSLSILLFMVHLGNQNMSLQFAWTVGYIIWLLVIKPASGAIMVSLQSMIGLLFGLTALFVGWGDGLLWLLVTGTALVCYLAARHFLDSFDEPYAKLLSYLWAFLGSGLVWVLGHWLLFYGFIAQPTLLLVAVGYGLAALYYLDHNDRLSKLIRLEILVTTVAIVLAVVMSLTIHVISTVRTLLR